MTPETLEAMTNPLLCLLTILAIAIGGCTGISGTLSELPGCADDSVKETVVDIVERPLEIIGAEGPYELRLIKMTDRNERTGAYSCDADVYTTSASFLSDAGGMRRIGSVAYTISESAEDSSQFIVEARIIPPSLFAILGVR